MFTYELNIERKRWGLTSLSLSSVNSPYDGGTAYAADGDDDAPCGDDAPCDGDGVPCGDVGGDDVAYGKAQVAFRKVYEFHNIHPLHTLCKGNDTDDQLYVY